MVLGVGRGARDGTGAGVFFAAQTEKKNNRSVLLLPCPVYNINRLPLLSPSSLSIQEASRPGKREDFPAPDQDLQFLCGFFVDLFSSTAYRSQGMHTPAPLSFISVILLFVL